METQGQPRWCDCCLTGKFPCPSEEYMGMLPAYLVVSEDGSFSDLQALRGFCPVHLNSFIHSMRLFTLILMVAAKLFAILSGGGRLYSNIWNFMFNAGRIWKTTAAIRKDPRGNTWKEGFRLLSWTGSKSWAKFLSYYKIPACYGSCIFLPQDLLYPFQRSKMINQRWTN